MIEDTKKQPALLAMASTETSSSTSSEYQDVETNLNNMATVELLELDDQTINTDSVDFEVFDGSNNNSLQPPATHIQPLWRWPWQRNRRRGGRA